jgi:adenosine deaminase
MAQLGLRIHPNTDNPTLHKVTPTKAWMMMVEDFGFGLDDLKGFMHNGLDAAWIDDAQRAKWTREWSTEFDTLRGQIK